MQPSENIQRIEELDALRGIAILGILVMNIQGFSMPSSAYINPLGLGALTSGEWAVWWFERVFVDYKFIGVFSLLFGAGIGLLADQVERKNGPVMITHYRRMIALAIIGGLHATLIWYGDILLSYAMIGAVIFLFRKLPASLLLIGGLLLTLPGIWELIEGQQGMNAMAREDQLAMAASFWAPSAEALSTEIARMQGSWADVHGARLESLNFMLGYLFLSETLWKTGGFMLIGLALYKYGFFTRAWSRGGYLLTACLGIGTGLAVAAYGLAGDVQVNFDISYSLNEGRAYLYVSSIMQAVGYAALAYWLFSFEWSKGARRLFAPVGRMALTNYILQSVICTFIFYGWGLGLFGTMNRVEQLFVVAGVWAVQMYLSHFWLGRFAYGPLEWLWRWAGKGERPELVRQ